MTKVLDNEEIEDESSVSDIESLNLSISEITNEARNNIEDGLSDLENTRATKKIGAILWYTGFSITTVALITLFVTGWYVMSSKLRVTSVK